MDENEIDPSRAYLPERKGTVEIVGIKNEPLKSNPIDYEGLNSDIKDRVEALKKLWKESKEFNPKGTELPITSGRRNRDEQKKLYKAYLRGDKNVPLAANPDLAPNAKFFHENAIDILPHVPDVLLNEVGLHRPYGKNDIYHVEINPKVEWKKPEEAPSLTEDEIDPYRNYLRNKPVYQPTTGESLTNLWEGFKNDITNPEFYTKALPKQAASVADTAYSIVPGAIQFVGTPVAKLGDIIGSSTMEALGKKVEDKHLAEKALSSLTSTMQQPFGKAFGITQEPAYRGEASRQIMEFVGENIGKGADWISEKTGLPKSDVEWYMNAALAGILPKAGKIAGKVAEKGVELGGEQLGKVVNKGGEIVGNAKETVLNKFPGLRPEENPNLRSVGAAEVPIVQQRINNARSLLEPIDLSRDQATRDFKDINWAREKAKNAATGEPLREHYANQNEKILRNFDKEIEATGAVDTGIERSELGQRLNDVVDKYKKERYQKVNDAYTRANEAGETLEQVPYKDLSNYIEKIKKDSPTQYNKNDILRIVEENIKANDPNRTGSINLRQMEDIRKLINEEAEPGTSNGFHGGKLRKAIDNVTANKGGALYKEARKLNEDYMNEFEDTPSIRSITSLKKGTTERTVPIETLAEKLMLSGPKSHVAEVFNTLEKAGPEGQQLVNELRGIVGEHIKNEATKSVQMDIKGNPTVSAAKLDSVIKKLDKSGKLEFIFGKQGAERLRTLNDVAKDVYTVPQGSVNYSGTASEIKNLLAPAVADLTASAMTGVPLPVTIGGTLGYKYLKNQKELNRINEFINYGKEK